MGHQNQNQPRMKSAFSVQQYQHEPVTFISIPEGLFRQKYTDQTMVSQLD